MTMDFDDDDGDGVYHSFAELLRASETNNRVEGEKSDFNLETDADEQEYDDYLFVDDDSQDDEDDIVHETINLEDSGDETVHETANLDGNGDGHEYSPWRNDSTSTAKKSSVSEPFVGQTFDSLEDAQLFYRDYANVMGFAVRIKTRRKSTVTNDWCSCLFQCKRAARASTNEKDTGSDFVKDRKGNGAWKEVRKRDSLSRSNCHARLFVSFKHGPGKWYVTKFEAAHSHDLVSPTKLKVFTEIPLSLISNRSCRDANRVGGPCAYNTQGVQAEPSSLQSMRYNHLCELYTSLALDASMTMKGYEHALRNLMEQRAVFARMVVDADDANRDDIGNISKEVSARIHGTVETDGTPLDPDVVATEGRRKEKRIKSANEVATSTKPLRKCRICNTHTNHDSRNHYKVLGIPQP